MPINMVGHTPVGTDAGREALMKNSRHGGILVLDLRSAMEDGYKQIHYAPIHHKLKYPSFLRVT